jgi:plasmid stabilization system protein ParE
MDGDTAYSLRMSEKALGDLWREIDYLNFDDEELGKSFYDDFQKTIARIQQNPFLYAEVILFVRRGLFKKFNFQLFYAVDEVNFIVEVIAILHQKQNPNIILQRLNLES